MIAQTKQAIDKLKAAGLTRSQFSVKTPRSKNGEYGNAEISLSYEVKGLDWAKAIASTGLYVIVLRSEIGDSLIVLDDYERRYKVQIQDHRDAQDLLDVKVSWMDMKIG